MASQDILEGIAGRIGFRVGARDHVAAGVRPVGQAGHHRVLREERHQSVLGGCRIGAEKAGKDLGVTVETVAPTKPDNIEEQTRLVEDWIVKKPDAFVFVPVDYKALVPSIQKATKAGIPVVNYNNRMTDIDAVTYIGSNDEEIEYQVSTFLFKSMGGKGKIVHIDGVPAASTAQARKRGLRARAEGKPRDRTPRLADRPVSPARGGQGVREPAAALSADRRGGLGQRRHGGRRRRGAGGRRQGRRQDQGDRHRRHPRRDGGDCRRQDVRDRRLLRPRPVLPRACRRRCAT